MLMFRVKLFLGIPASPADLDLHPVIPDDLMTPMVKQVLFHLLPLRGQ